MKSSTLAGSYFAPRVAAIIDVFADSIAAIVAVCSH
jgi:hypothetical protein